MLTTEILNLNAFSDYSLDTRSPPYFKYIFTHYSPLIFNKLVLQTSVIAFWLGSETVV